MFEHSIRIGSRWSESFQVATYNLEYVADNVVELQRTPIVDYKENFHHVGTANSRKQYVTSQFFNVLLEALVEELMQLWKGVVAYDVFKELGSRAFKLRPVLLWTIHNFFGYRTVAGVAHQCYSACPVCGPFLKGEHSFELGKQTHTNTRR